MENNTLHEGSEKTSLKELISRAIAGYERTMERKLDIGSLYQRNEIAHKWKVTYKVYVLRETSCWRFVDIAKQALILGEAKAILGARIMTRAAIETISSLVFINSKIEALVSGKIDFSDFNKSIDSLVLGSRINPNAPPTINVLTMIKTFEKKHKGIQHHFDSLCESAHPSYEGLIGGYAKTDYKYYKTTFGNFWLERYKHSHEMALWITMDIFESEYNEEWHRQFLALENWLVSNDEKLTSIKL